jgi:hypothetical protein
MLPKRYFGFFKSWCCMTSLVPFGVLIIFSFIQMSITSIIELLSLVPTYPIHLIQCTRTSLKNIMF